MSLYTQFYFNQAAEPYAPATWRGGWDLNGTALVSLDGARYGTAGSTTATRAEAVSTSPYRVGVLRGVSRRLAPQTISGTVDMVLGISESNIAADFFTRLHIYIVKTTDDSVLGTLLNQYEETSGGGATEWPTTNTGTALQSAQALTSVAVPNDGVDYRLVVEIGYRSENVSTTSRTGTIRYGGLTTATLNRMSDLTVGSTSVTTLAGFLSFSSAIEISDAGLTNLEIETATDITALPFTATQTVDAGGVTYTVWYKHTATADGVITFFGFGDLVTYRPTLSGRSVGDPYPTTLIQGINDPGADYENKGYQQPVEAGRTYYVRWVPNTGNPTPAVLHVLVEVHTDVTAGVNSILVNDDVFDYAALISSEQDYVSLRYVQPFAAGEAGDILDSGVSLFEYSALLAGGTGSALYYYDTTLTQVGTLTWPTGDGVPRIRTNQGTQTFWVGRNSDPVIVRKVLADGTFDPTTWTLTGHPSVLGFATSNDETIAYHSRDVTVSGGAITSADPVIRRYDLVGLADLADLATGPANQACADILVLGDGTIVASFCLDDVTTFTVRRYAPDGTLLNTYTIGLTIFPGGPLGFPRLAYAINDPASFWVWWHPTDIPGISRFQEIQVSDGSILNVVHAAEYEFGRFAGAQTDDPPSMFGISSSCPFVILRTALVEGIGGQVIGPLVWVEWPRSIP